MPQRFNALILLLLAICGAAPGTPLPRLQNLPDKPNFSGTWILNLEKSKLNLPGLKSTRFVIEHKEPMFRLTRTHVTTQGDDTRSFELTTDGKEKVVEPGGIRVSVRWIGRNLLLNTRQEVSGGVETNRVEYSLSLDGKTFTAREHNENPDGKHDRLWVFDRAK